MKNFKQKVLQNSLILDEKSVPIGTSYYAVAVALKHNSRKAFDFVTMKGLKSCHVNYGDTAGWVTPVGLLNNKGINSIILLHLMFN